MTFLKNKPFLFMLMFIFTCTSTKAIYAGWWSSLLSTPPSSPSFQKSSEVVILGNEDSMFLKKKEGKWRVMESEGSSYYQKVEIEDVARIVYLLMNGSFESRSTLLSA